MSLTHLSEKMIYWNKVRELGYTKPKTLSDLLSRSETDLVYRQRLLHMCSHFSALSSKSANAAQSSEGETLRVLDERRDGFMGNIERAKKLVEELDIYRRMLGFGIPIKGSNIIQLPDKDYYSFSLQLSYQSSDAWNMRRGLSMLSLL